MPLRLKCSPLDYEHGVAAVDIVVIKGVCREPVFPCYNGNGRLKRGVSFGIKWQNAMPYFHQGAVAEHYKEEGADGKRQVRAFRATGTVGRALASKLAERGQTFRVVGRSEQRLRRDFGANEPPVEYCAADLRDPVAAARAAAGVDTIFYTVGVPYPQFEQHPKRTRVALEAAAAAGVRHFVHLSTVYPYGVPQQDFVSESHPRNPTAFKGRMRKEQEDVVQAADNPKGMRTTILRPPDFYGPDSELSYVRAIFDAAIEGRDR